MKRLRKVLFFVILLVLACVSVLAVADTGTLTITTGNPLLDVFSNVLVAVVIAVVAWILKKKVPPTIIQMLQDFVPIAVSAVEQMSKVAEKAGKPMAGADKMNKALKIVNQMVEKTTKKALSDEDKALTQTIIEAAVSEITNPKTP